VRTTTHRRYRPSWTPTCRTRPPMRGHKVSALQTRLPPFSYLSMVISTRACVRYAVFVSTSRTFGAYLFLESILRGSHLFAIHSRGPFCFRDPHVRAILEQEPGPGSGPKPTCLRELRTRCGFLLPVLLGRRKAATTQDEKHARTLLAAWRHLVLCLDPEGSRCRRTGLIVQSLATTGSQA